MFRIVRNLPKSDVRKYSKIIDEKDLRLSGIYHDILQSEKIDNVKETINMGFAFIGCNRKLFLSESYSCFYMAKKLDKNKEHTELINLGIEQLQKNDSEKIDLFAIID